MSCSYQSQFLLVNQKLNTFINDVEKEELLVIQWIDDTKVGENRPKSEGEFNTKEDKKVSTQNCMISWNQRLWSSSLLFISWTHSYQLKPNVICYHDFF